MITYKFCWDKSWKSKEIYHFNPIETGIGIMNCFKLSLVLSTYTCTCIIFFSLGYTARPNYFNHFEANGSNRKGGGVKAGGPREKQPDHPRAELGVSHV